MCGEHFIISARGLGKTGSSPHVRGAPERFEAFARAVGIIPACAGSTESAANHARSRRDHPRMCGEHLCKTFCKACARGSSPPVRGAQFRGEFVDHLVGIIPACAGSTTGVAASAKVTRDHPRMCGEHGRLATMPCRSPGSSPHVRGARAGRLCGVPRSGIIPACAGSTPTATRPSREPRDHPRMCGEHLPDVSLAVPLPGSSPHVRGARPCLPLVAEPCGIIPACAGSTVGR